MARPGPNNPNGEQKRYKQTVEVITLLKQAFSIGCTDAEACIHAGIGQSALYEWRAEDEKLAEEFDKLKQNPILKAKKTVVDSLSDPKNAQWYLERKCKGEFSTRTENDVTSSDGSLHPTRIQITGPDDDS